MTSTEKAEQTRLIDLAIARENKARLFEIADRVFSGIPTDVRSVEMPTKDRPASEEIAE